MSPKTGRWRRVGLLAFIVLIATCLRAYRIGQSSYWYDEVVTIRLVKTADPGALFRLLREIDATRAPLHPLLLQTWVKVFGPSEPSGRGFSVICGVLTILVIKRLARRFFDDDRIGLWAAWLAAWSPLLIVYSRETRMYAWLVLVTCLCWDALLSLGQASWTRSVIAYSLGLAALVYSHPLGLLMAGALGLASLLNRRALETSWKRWLGAHGLAGLIVAPWIANYLDHDPESTVGRLPIRFFVGTPIGFLGGNFLTLAGMIALISYSVFRRKDGSLPRIDRPASTSILLIWLIVPPTVLYVYSWIGHPIFGPARYTLFVAPAFLLLVARGITRLRGPLLWATAGIVWALSLASLPATVFAPDLKADWRLAGETLDRLDPDQVEPVIVISTDPNHNVEIETARYYLGTKRPVFEPMARWKSSKRSWTAVGVRDGRTTAPVPESTDAIDLPGLRLIPSPPSSETDAHL